jgi:DNA-binding protein HU-beta
MNKNELIEKMAVKASISKVSATKALNTALDSIQNSLTRGQRVNLVGFGTFSVAKRGSRIGRNPRTGEEIKIPARQVPKFSPGKELKKAVK